MTSKRERKIISRRSKCWQKYLVQRSKTKKKMGRVHNFYERACVICQEYVQELLWDSAKRKYCCYGCLTPAYVPTHNTGTDDMIPRYTTDILIIDRESGTMIATSCGGTSTTFDW